MRGSRRNKPLRRPTPTRAPFMRSGRQRMKQIGELGSLEELKASWTDALQRNDTRLTIPLLDKALNKQGILMSPNSLALLKLRRAAMETGLAVLEESAPTMPAQTDERADPNVRLKPSPGFSEHVEAFFAESAATPKKKRAIRRKRRSRTGRPCSCGGNPSDVLGARVLQHTRRDFPMERGAVLDGCDRAPAATLLGLRPLCRRVLSCWFGRAVQDHDSADVVAAN